MTTAQQQRGLHWFQALAGDAQPQQGLPASLRVADGELAGQAVRYTAPATVRLACSKAGAWPRPWMKPSRRIAITRTSAH